MDEEGSRLASGFGFEVPTWNLLYEMLLDLTDRIRFDGFKPDIIVGISRGGWFPARILSDLLDNPRIASVGAEFYVGIYDTSCEPRLTQPIAVDVSDKRILLVDDVVDTGKSAVLIKSHLSRQGAKEIKLLTIYHKPWSVIKPDFFSKDTCDWIVFPWEVKETLAKLAKKCEMTRESFEAAISSLVNSGVNKNLVERLLKKQNIG